MQWMHSLLHAATCFMGRQGTLCGRGVGRENDGSSRSDVAGQPTFLDGPELPIPGPDALLTKANL